MIRQETEQPRRPARRFRSRSEPGSCKASSFFDDYPRFYESSKTSANPDRLNLRYEAIFGQNRDVFQRARVLDVASHDGRWSLAALATGAKFVTGVEGRAELVDHAVENLAAYGYGSDRAEFVQGDIFDVFAKRTFDVDVVICLGFLYHTIRYHELLDGITRGRPRHIIIDTQAKSMMNDLTIVELQNERVAREGNAINDVYSQGRHVLIGRPNLKAIRLMMKHYGYAVEKRSDWAGLVRDNPGVARVDDYRRQTRLTLRFARIDETY